MRHRAAVVLLAAILAVGSLSAETSAEAASPAPASSGQLIPPPSQRDALAKQFLANTPAASPATRPKTVAHLDPKLAGAATTTGTTDVNISGSVPEITKAVTAVGGTVQAAADNAVAATVPSAALTRLAGSAGVSQVKKPVQGYTDGLAVSQGVAASGAASWQSTGSSGNGVTVAIVDAGFAGLANDGALPSGLTVTNDDCADATGAPTVNGTSHGTAVAEIVHQMAPGATLALYCVRDTLGLLLAESQIQAAGIKIVNCSLAFPGDDRGDDGSTSGANTAAAIVKTARQAGILWIQSAGNSGLDHWTGTLVRDPDNPRLSKLDSTRGDLDYINVPRNGTVQIFLQWDDWPVSNLDITLFVETAFDGGASGQQFPLSAEQVPGTSPTLSYCIAPGASSVCLDSSQFPSGGQQIAIAIGLPLADSTGALPAIPPLAFSLDYEATGSTVITANALSCVAYSTGTPSTCMRYAPSPGSVAQPASSPYALAVGAADASGRNACGSDTNNTGTYPLEGYSARGPNIDNVPKPDLVAFDGTANNVLGTFCGTSAAAPHVAGAAALVAQMYPTLNADGLQSYLTQRANNGAPLLPATNAMGSGLPSLGSSLSAAQTLTQSVAGRGSLIATFTGKVDNVANGVDDIIAVYTSGTWVVKGAPTQFYSPAQQWSSAPFYGTRATLLADVNGDGLPDLIAVNDASTWVMTSNGAGFNAPALWSNQPFYGSVTTLAANVTGGAAASLIAVNAGNSYVMSPTGSSTPTSFGAPALWSTQAFYGSKATLAADVSGDGAADLIAVNGSNSYVMTAKNGGFNAPTLWSSQPFYGSIATTAANVNGSSVASIVAVNSGSSYVMSPDSSSNPAAFGAPTAWSNGAFYGTVATLTGRFDSANPTRAGLLALNPSSAWVAFSQASSFATPRQWG